MQINAFNLFLTNLIYKDSGIAIYVDVNLNCLQLNDFSTYNEYVALTISGKTKQLNVFAIYRSPNSSLDNDELLFNMNNKVCNKFKNDIIFMGDFNYPKLNWTNIINKDKNNMPTNSSDHFCKSLKNNFLIQHILQPTRIRDNQSQNILDLLITNGDIIDNIEFNDPLRHSDHMVLKCNYAFVDNIDYYTNPIFLRLR